MDLKDRRAQEDFFHRHLHDILPRNEGIRIAASSYDEEWSALRYLTASGPLVVRVNEITKPETDVAHRTGFVARLLAESAGQAPETYIRSARGLLNAAYANFEKPINCPGGAEVFAWDSTRRLWPRPFYIRRWVEGPNLAILPQIKYFKQAGAALRKFHALRFSAYYESFKAVAENQPSHNTAIFAMEKWLAPVENLLPLVTAQALRKLPYEAGTAIVGLLSNTFFGNNILIDDSGRVRVLDWEKASIGDLAQDFFPLKYWTMVDRRSGWYVPNGILYDSFCRGYGQADYAAIKARPAYTYLEAQWLLQRLGAAARRWAEGGLREPYPEPDFYVRSLNKLVED